MKRLILSVLVMVVSFGVSGQTKLDLTLSRMVSEAAESKLRTGQAQGGQMVKVCAVLADGAEVPEGRLGELGIKVQHVAYGIVDMVVPVGALSALDGIEEFSAYESPRVSEFKDAKSRNVMGADVMQDASKAKEEGLPSTYDGKGVIVGVFDGGIDFNHVNFRDQDSGKSRIAKAIVFRKYNGDGPFADVKNKVYNADSIIEIYKDAAHIDTLTTDNVANHHGTHTSGIAAGSYDGDIVSPTKGKVMLTGQRGVAYRSDLILAGAGTAYREFQRRALEEMANYADTLQEPLVVNLSIGYNCDWMDGKNVMGKFYDKFTANGTAPGRIVCISAGNEGDERFSVFKHLDETNDYTVRAILDYDNDVNPCVLSRVYFYVNDTTDVNVQMEMWEKSANGQFVRDSIFTEQWLNQKGWLIIQRSSAHDNRTCGELYFQVNGYHTQIPNLYFVIKISSKYGTPCNVRMFQVNANNFYVRRPFLENGITNAGFVTGDASSSFNTDACTNSVLSVGSWSAVDRWYDLNDSLRVTSNVSQDYPVGDVTHFSSYTTADDNGIQRPDFCAPGVSVVSSMSPYDTAGLTKNYCAYTIGNPANEPKRHDGLKSYFGAESGTSMACPNAVGVIALWLQANPKLCVNDIRDVIKHTADWGNISEGHKYRAGMGRINALAGLKYILEHYPTDIQDIVDGQPKGLVETEARKVLEDGRLVIVRGGQKYSVAGQKIK